jgi:uncharacterized damage-inducible protein DinB
MSGRMLLSGCAFAHAVTTRNVEGIDHDESLRPDGTGKTIHWILGHMTATRCSLLRFLGAESIWTADEIALFQRGAAPSEASAAAMTFDRMVADYGKTQDTILARLGTMSDEDFAKKGSPKGLGGETTGEQISAFLLHEAYHAGQIGILRRTIGKEGALR